MNEPQKPKNKRQEARDRTREQLLRAGEELVREAFEKGTADPLRFLSPSEVTARASTYRDSKSLSQGMLYHLWQPIGDSGDKLAAYRKDLLERVLDLPFDPGGVRSRALELMEAAAREGRQVELQDLVRAVGEFEFGRYAFPDERARKVRFSTLMLLFAENALMNVDPSVREDLRREMAAETAPRSYDELKRTYGLLLEQLGLTMAEGFTIDDLVQGIWAMLDGFTLHSWHFETLTLERAWRSTPGWTLFSISALLFVEALTVRDEKNADEEQLAGTSTSTRSGDRRIGASR